MGGGEAGLAQLAGNLLLRSLPFPSFRLLHAGITSGSPGTPCSPTPALIASSSVLGQLPCCSFSAGYRVAGQPWTGS